MTLTQRHPTEFDALFSLGSFWSHHDGYPRLGIELISLS